MKTSIEWLKEYSDINVDAKTLADRLKGRNYRTKGK